MTARRVAMLLLILATVDCGEIVGIHDVPTPTDASGNSAPEDATAVDGKVADSSGAIPDASMHDASQSNDGSLGDAMSPVVDAAADGLAPEAAADASVDAAPDAASCAPHWNVFNTACNNCGIARCCGALATCQALGDGGQGVSRCSALVTCITGYTGTNPPGTGDNNCKNDGMYSPSEYALGETTLSCVRTMCPTECNGL